MKFELLGLDSFFLLVAPFAGAWIEIIKLNDLPAFDGRRSLRGGVD